MKIRTTALLLATMVPFCLLLSFKQENNPGKILFQQNCGACHAKSKELVGPAFQFIRNDYGLNWTLRFVKDGRTMIERKDSKALYSFYKYQEMQHVGFPSLTKNEIVQILDYVDDTTGSTAPVDMAQYAHRKLSEKERQQFIKVYEEKKAQTKVEAESY